MHNFYQKSNSLFRVHFAIVKDMAEIAIVILSATLLLVGLVGVFVPLLPGAPLAWLGIFLYAYFTNFQELTLFTLLIFLALTALTFLIDIAAPALGAQKYKASKYGILGALLGVGAGIVMMGPIGIIIGPFLGSFIGELLAGKKYESAFRSSLGALVGFIASAFLKGVLVLTMLGFFLVALLF